ncbi:hypothetical protein ACFFWD_03485 [Bradyrhizobium erythrophlei]|uniref:hypothetical protein n=1 Tax=Bradyrhizobium erythrophlei TaxID=1437360 RepID=UPI0035F02686
MATFQASGVPNPAPDLAAHVTAFVKDASKGIPISQLANVSPAVVRLQALR